MAIGGATRHQRRAAVTENVPPMSTMMMTWVPERPGRWLFHCHRAAHMSGVQQLHLAGRPSPPLRDMDAVAGHGDHLRTGMGGLVMGITVTGPSPVAAVHTDARPLRLLVQPRAGRYGRSPGFGYVLQDGGATPNADSIQIPGPTIALRRGVPVAITVVNRLARATAVHWHGIELDSYYDGVAGWSGGGDGSAATTPMIAPGDSFVARFTPPRAGTFIYHTHVNESYQLSSGLYGALVVLDGTDRLDPATDHVMIFGQDGPSDSGLVVMNGAAPPRPLAVQAGVRQRFRFVNMIPQDMVELDLNADGRRARWTAVAKDGADLPAGQRSERDAALMFGPGETYDFEMTPKRGTIRLAVRSFNSFTATILAH
jgi:FtsP/CotA-like multicopper oxidase with cupredoxin domain